MLLKQRRWYHVRLWNHWHSNDDTVSCDDCNHSWLQDQRQEEIKAKPPSIAKWLAAHTLIRGEKPQQKRHPFLPLLYHTIRRVSTWFVTRFFICGQHYLYRQEEIKAKPPSIAKWLAAYPTFIRGEKPYQKRHPFLPLLYHIIRRVSNWFVTRFLYAPTLFVPGKG